MYPLIKYQEHGTKYQEHDNKYQEHGAMYREHDYKYQEHDNKYQEHGTKYQEHLMSCGARCSPCAPLTRLLTSRAERNLHGVRLLSRVAIRPQTVAL